MRLLCTADWHLSDNPRDAYRYAFLDWLWRYVKKNCDDRLDGVAVLGDLTEDRNNHSAELVNRLVNVLERISRKVDLYVLRGNHDASDPDLPFFRFLDNPPYRRFITKPELVEWGNGTRLFVVPHGPWPASIPECDLVLAHHTFAGAESESGMRLPGLRMPLGGPPVISGDVHVPQSIGRVTYVGAPHTIDFGDAFEPRVLLVDTDTGHRFSVPTNLPGKRLVELETGARLALPDTQDAFSRGDLVKVRMRVSVGCEQSLTELRAAVTDWCVGLGASSCSIVLALDDKVRPISVPSRKSDADLVKAYAGRHGLDEKLGLSFIEKG
jgi:hypothetical protein